MVDERGSVSGEHVVIVKADARRDATHGRREGHRLSADGDGAGGVAAPDCPGDVRAVFEEQRPARIEQSGPAEEHVMGDASRGATRRNERMRVVDSGIDDADFYAGEVADGTRGWIDPEGGPHRVRLD